MKFTIVREHEAINNIKPYVEKDMVKKQALKLAKTNIESSKLEYPQIICNKENVIIMGIAYYYAAQELGFSSIEIIHLPESHGESETYFQYLDYIISNNSSIIKQMKMMKSIKSDHTSSRTLISDNHKSMENQRINKLCNLIAKPSVFIQNGFYFFSLFETSKCGIELEKIKTDSSLVNVFCDNLYYTLKELIGVNFNNHDWCICTTPKRRHKNGFHFASAICEEASKKLEIPFYRDIVITNNRSRMNPSFILQFNPKEKNIILFDDILTTGITMRETRKLLIAQNHTIIPIVGIRNK